MIIFKGENFQKAWVPSDMGKNWQWTSNSKGWTCDIITLEWITRVFDPETRAKANGKQRALVCDGHGSHVQPEVLRFCIDNKISLLLMAPHSSHLCQPLDVGIFSPLKTYMTAELDKIMRYGISNIKKFEWADAYRLARPKAMTETNIKSAFRTAGLVPLNRRKVLVRMPEFSEADVDSDNKINDAPTPVEAHPFAEIPSTPSRITPDLLNRANAALIANIEGGIFDTPTRKFIPQLVAVAEYNSAQVVVSNHQIEAKDRILTKRREHTTGIRSVLKGKHVVSTEELYTEVKVCKDATRAKKASAGRKGAKNTSVEGNGDHGGY
jgi:DDE superfamily endonuclease